MTVDLLVITMIIVAFLWSILFLLFSLFMYADP